MLGVEAHAWPTPAVVRPNGLSFPGRLQAGLPPYSPVFKSWIHCWKYLSVQVSELGPRRLPALLAVPGKMRDCESDEEAREKSAGLTAAV